MEDTKNPTQESSESEPEGELAAPDAQDAASVAAQRDDLARERASLEDQLLRMRAEFENFRKRAQREREEFSEFSTSETVRELIPVLDDFERALKTECADKAYAQGMTLIYQRLLDALKKMGLEPVETEGQKFDPALHHAVETEKTDRVEDQTILYQHQRGYNFKGKLLRPAIVKVALQP